MRKQVERRYSVDAVFADGKRISVRDFYLATYAAAFVTAIKDTDLYPGRPYRLEIVPFEVTEEDVGNVGKTR
jgi:hypothetical protein